VTIFTLGDPDPNDATEIVRSPGIPLGDYGYYFSTRYSNRAQLLLQEMDIIHCHHLLMSVEMAHRYGSAPIIYTNHTRYDLYTGTIISIPQPAADAIMRKIWPEFSDFADIVITPSESVKTIMEDFGVRRPIRLIENGVDLRAFHHPSAPQKKHSLGWKEDDVVVTYVGRLAAEKNLELLLEQFAIANELAPNLRLMLIGDGPARQTLQKKAAELNLESTARFLGAVPAAMVANILSAADFFATASISEVHPLTIIEAMGAGLPVIASHSPGISDTVESKKTGLLTNHPRGGLAAGMVALALNPDLRQKMGQQAFLESKRYSIEKTVEKTIQLYEECLQMRPDLTRRNLHGQRVFELEALKPWVEQLFRLLQPAKRAAKSSDRTYD
jgi:1,2-diacylglycerol 3-alpha-glucosyltransferase